MAEPKTLLVKTRPGAESVPMSVSQYNAMMHSMPPQERRLVTVRGQVEGVAETIRGNLTKKKMSSEEVAARIDRGENPVLFGADDPRRQALRREEQEQIDSYIAANSPEAQAAMLYRFMPIIGQQLQNAAVGTEEATEFRQKLLSANTGKQIIYDMLGLAGGAAYAGKLIPGVASNFTTTTGLKGFRNLMAGGAAADTVLYAQYLADHNLPFRAEDYGRELLTGALINLPIAGIGAARGAILEGARAVVGGTLEGVGGAADLLVTKAVLSKPGSAGAAQAARAGAATRLLSKWGRKIRGKKVRPTTAFDPLGDAQKWAKYQEKQIAKVTPDALAKMSIDERTAMLKEVQGWAGMADNFDGIKFELVPERLRAGERTVRSLDEKVNTLSTKVGGGVKGLGRSSTKQKGAFVAEMQTLMNRLDDNGWGDMARFLDRTLDTQVVATKQGAKVRQLKQSPHQVYGKLVKARLYAALNRNVMGGAAEADDALKAILRNREIWGKGKAVPVASEVNSAIDKLAKSQRELRRLSNQRVNNLDIGREQKGRAARINTQLNNIRESYEVLERLRLVSEGTADSWRAATVKASRAISEGDEAWKAAGKINDARRKASGVITERLGRVEQGVADFRAQQARSAVEEADRIVKVRKSIEKVLGSGATSVLVSTAAAAPVGGVVALRQMKRYEKEVMFNHLSDQITALAGSPETFEERLNEALGASQDADPDVTMLAGVQSSMTLHYLNNALPRPALSTVGGMEPAYTQKDAFLQKYAAIMDPLSVAYAAAQGTVTADMIEALRVTQQAAYAELSNMLIEALQKMGPKSPRKTINGIQMFIGGVDPLYSGETLRLLQSNYAQNEQQQQQIYGPGPLQGQFNQSSPTDRGNNFTYTQRLTSY